MDHPIYEFNATDLCMETETLITCNRSLIKILDMKILLTKMLVILNSDCDHYGSSHPAI